MYCKRVSGTHLKPYIHVAVQSGDEKDATKKRNDCTKASFELECEVSKLNCSSIWEQLNSSNFLRLWRTGANELHYEAKEDDETLDVSEMVVSIYLHVYSLFKDYKT